MSNGLSQPAKSLSQIMPPLSFREKWARRLTREKLRAELNRLDLKGSKILTGNSGEGGLIKLNDGYIFDSYKLPIAPSLDISRKSSRRAYELHVCIIGAGLSGLYIAMLLDSLDLPGLSYDIFEASDSAGGRAKTHHFSSALHEYCDIGAMRYPKIPFMHRAFQLLDLVNVSLLPYHMKGLMCPKLYNGVLQTGPQMKGNDDFGFSLSKGGSVPDCLVSKGPDEVLEEAFKPYKDALARDFDQNFEFLLQEDGYTTREFLSERMNYDYHTVQWLETTCSATGLFDQAFTESVIDSLDLDYPVKPEAWFCIDGGASCLIEGMQAVIKGKVELKKRVESISIDRAAPDRPKMTLKIHSEDALRNYATVFNTTSLPCMQRMDLENAGIHPTQREAIRSLHYDASAKVAIKFTYPWWITKCGIRSGGTATTDLPLRTCVYPSYNLRDKETAPAVLLCSYTWAQDALRLGSLISANSPKGEEQLIELMLRDLARLHANNITLDEIKEAYMTHHSYDWYSDPCMSGAFALFGPGQFSNLYPYLSRPTADGLLHIVGEATSAHHAWIVGALDSAYRAVYHFLLRFEEHDTLERLRERFGDVNEMETGEDGTAHLQVALGRLPPEEHVRVSRADELEEYVIVPRHSVSSGA